MASLPSMTPTEDDAAYDSPGHDVPACVVKSELRLPVPVATPARAAIVKREPAACVPEPAPACQDHQDAQTPFHENRALSAESVESSHAGGEDDSVEDTLVTKSPAKAD